MTFPGAAVWHVPWTDKNDALDWQAYFHHRNRFIAALLHSPYERGGRMVRESLNHQIKHLVSMQYSTVEIRHKALAGRAGRSRAAARRPADEAGGDQRLPQAVRRRAAAGRPRRLPAGAPQEAAAQGQGRRRDPGPHLAAGHRRAWRRSASCDRPAKLAREYPEAELSAMDAKWYRLARYDSAIVSMNDGTSAALYQRDPDQFLDLLKRTLEIHQQLRREWPRLAARVPRRPRRRHVAGGVGGDVPSLDGRRPG